MISGEVNKKAVTDEKARPFLLMDTAEEILIDCVSTTEHDNHKLRMIHMDGLMLHVSDLARMGLAKIDTRHTDPSVLAEIKVYRVICAGQPARTARYITVRGQEVY